MMHTQQPARTRYLGAVSVTAGLVIAIALLVWLAMFRSGSGSSQAGAVVVPTQRAADVPVAVASEPVTNAILVVRDPQAAIQLRIAAETGNECFVSSFPSRLRTSGEELDKRILAVGGVERWIEPYVTWVGSAAGAVEAFRGSWAGRREDRASEVWIQVSRSGKDVGVQLLLTTTPSGNEVWTVGSDMRAATVCS